MKNALAMLAAGAFIVLAGNSVRAAPIALPNATPNATIIPVAEGCGVGWHRGPYGGCRRNLTPAWPCWWRRGPFGRWYRVCH